MANRPASNYYPDIGVLGEELVAQWLQSQGWKILHRRWRCRWGEIDLVAKLDLPCRGAEGADLAEGAEEADLAGGEIPIQNHATSLNAGNPRTRVAPKSRHFAQRGEPAHTSGSKIQNPKSPHPSLAFVEVKTRSRAGWDAGGLLAVTAKKQAKIWQTARCFLAAYPDLADYPCQFDVALVSYQKLPRHHTQPLKTPLTLEAARGLSSSVQLGQAIIFAGNQLVLQEYLPSAFD